jgi:pilus assembly protein CpaE
MTQSLLRGVLVSRDAALREAIHGVARESQGALAVILDVTSGFGEMTADQVHAVQACAPAVVFIDIQDDTETGLALARHLSGGSQPLAVVLLGPLLSAEALLAAMRAGVAEFFPLPLDRQAVLDALPRLREKLPGSDSPGGQGRVYAFFSAKGGSGATTVATNLAIEVHKRTGKKTLLVDLDPELGEISLLLGVQPQFNFVDLVQNFHRMDTGLLSSYIEQHSSGVHLLSAPYHPDKAAAVSEEQVRNILAYLRTQYDYVFVDAKSFGPSTLAAFEQSDDVFLVATVDLPSLRNIQRGLPLIRRVMPRGDDQVRLVINRYNPDDEISLKDVQKTLGLPVYATLANDYEAVIASINAGKPLVLQLGKSPVTRDLKALAGRLVGAGAGAGTPHVNGRPKGGLLGRLTGTFRTADPGRAGKQGT